MPRLELVEPAEIVLLENVNPEIPFLPDPVNAGDDEETPTQYESGPVAPQDGQDPGTPSLSDQVEEEVCYKTPPQPQFGTNTHTKTILPTSNDSSQILPWLPEKDLTLHMTLVITVI